MRRAADAEISRLSAANWRQLLPRVPLKAEPQSCVSPSTARWGRGDACAAEYFP